MSKPKLFSFILLCFTLYQGYSQTNRLIKKAEISLEKGNVPEAIANYSAALTLDPQNIKANMGLGMIYSDLQDNYLLAQPYLEKALHSSRKDSLYDLIFELAKCYQYNQEFDRAISFFNRLNNITDTEGESNFQAEIEKRRRDCEFAKLHANDSPNKNFYLVNAGTKLNTNMPEYVPVLLNSGQLIFTSKRQDHPKEELNYLDGKYFESVYYSKIGPSAFSPAMHFTLPEKFKNAQFYNHHFSIVSASNDGKTLYTFKDSKLHEIPLTESVVINPETALFDNKRDYENHAFLTRNGSELYFTTDKAGGFGGTDIYCRTRKPDGTWTEPVNLGPSINTQFNEESPFVTVAGELYFASEGHSGFGNYDMYRSHLENGSWSRPENLGAPINTTGQDIFLVMDSTETIGYFASDRPGGQGDMDIYKIINLDKYKKDCQPFAAEIIRLSAEDKDTSDFKNTVILHLPDNYKVLSTKWNINGENIDTATLSLEKDYGRAGTYAVSVKITAGCDTCLNPVVACLNFANKIERIAPTIQTPKPYTKDSLLNIKLATCFPDPQARKRSKMNIAGIRRDSAGIRAISDSELLTLGLSNQRFLFDLNKSDLTSATAAELKTIAGICAGHSDLGIVLVGYADARGNLSSNKDLSLKRAKEVKKYLVLRGVLKNSIISVEGQGAAGFLNDCGPGVDCPEEQHMQNRRVELIFVRISTK